MATVYGTSQLIQQSSMMSTSSPTAPRTALTSWLLLDHALDPVCRPIAEEPLGGSEALAHELASPVGGAARLDGIAECAGVGRNLDAARTTEQTIDRRIEVAPFCVPQRAVDGADGHHRQAFATVH